ncbi:hypothetical protein [Klebsiella phage 05F01]|nr:hypothetical protein [Klebsiella phage 05F01]
MQSKLKELLDAYADKMYELGENSEFCESEFYMELDLEITQIREEIDEILSQFS